MRRYGRLFVVSVVSAMAVTISLIASHVHSQPTFTARPACDILTPAVAHKLAGTTAKLQPEHNSSTADTRTSYCVYRGATQSIALVVRSARDAGGVALNKAAFTAPLTTSVTVRGYGDAAYWSPAFAQLNILEHNTWYILSNGPGVPSQRTLPDAKKLADLVAPQL